MPNVTIKNNTVVWTISRGVSESLTINSSAGWAQYDLIVLDLKVNKALEEYPLLRLTVGKGLTISGDLLIINISYQTSSALPAGLLNADIKLKLAGIVLPPVPIILQVQNTVSKVL